MSARQTRRQSRRHYNRHFYKFYLLIIPGVSMANACRMDFEDKIPYTANFPHAGDNPYNAS